MKLKLLVLILLTFSAFSWGQNYTPHHYQQNDWFLDFGENTAQYVNPASIAENDQIEIALGLFTTIRGKAGQEFLSIVHPFDYNHSVGFTIFENGSSLETDDNTSFNAYIENAYQFGYAYRFGPKMFGSHVWSVGANLSLLQFSLFKINEFMAYGMDLGLSYNPISNSKFGHLQFGLAIQNIVQPKVEFAQQGNSSDDSYTIPMNVNPSVFWRGFNRKLEIAASYSMVNIVPWAEDVVGALPWVSKEKAIGSVQFLPSIRAIYYLAPMVGVKAKWSKQGYPVLGATINMKRVNLFRYLQVDVDVSHDQLTTTDEERGFAFNLKAVTRVGPTREERIGAARYRRLKLEPEDLYREAMRLYLARKFLLAAYKFGEVITKYPAFHLVDQAAFYKGKSFENLRMHISAKKVYTDAIKKYEMSDVKPRYHFQMMNIYYKEGKYDEASQKYQLISNLYKESDIIPDADYVMGQIRFIQKDYTDAVRLLQPILPGNGNYVYARYTLAMCYFRQKQKEEAIGALKDIMDVSPSNISEQELQDIASVKLGHLAFDAEPPQLLEAAKFYAAVPPTSSKYDEALLGLTWSFLRVQKFKDALNASNTLISSAPNSFLVGEAYLLRGYCEYFEKDYSASIKSLDLAIEKSNAQIITDADVDAEKQKNSETVTQFEEVQKTALSLSNQLPSTQVIQRMDELRPKFDDVVSKHESYMDFLSLAGESGRFTSNRERVIRDAKFTKATVSQKLGTEGEKKAPSIDELQELELE